MKTNFSPAAEYTHIRPIRALSSKQALNLLLPKRDQLGISRLTDTGSYLDLGVVIVSATRTNVDNNQVTSTQGKAFCLNNALVGALAEAAERYCASNFSGPHCIEGYNNLNPDGEPLDEVFGYGEAYYPSKWIQGLDLLTGKESWVPALEVCFPYKRQNFDPVHIRPSTTGLAAGGNINEARLYAILEIVERNITSLFYRNVRKASNGYCVDLRTITDERARTLIERFLVQGYELIVFRVFAVLPTYYVAALDTCRLAPKFMIAGTSTALSESDALNGALLECVQGLVTGLAGSREDLLRASSKYRNQSHSKRNIFYTVRDNLIKQNGVAQYAESDCQETDCDSALQQVLAILDGLANGPFVCCDLSCPAMPLNVIKVVAPCFNDWLVNPRR